MPTQRSTSSRKDSVNGASSCHLCDLAAQRRGPDQLEQVAGKTEALEVPQQVPEDDGVVFQELRLGQDRLALTLQLLPQDQRAQVGHCHLGGAAHRGSLRAGSRPSAGRDQCDERTKTQRACYRETRVTGQSRYLPTGPRSQSSAFRKGTKDALQNGQDEFRLESSDVHPAMISSS
ncbi:hypothetical protein EYF80_059827 [Liparis tanakae]|uniref:Uncharacterized protein n=1 Tax=Liparis tanakae TaxID=230148 RepID=A0A4Z2EME8_9TELE|nr:hypothetical protein EYF80_059827 [Liparis tanakae]